MRQQHQAPTTSNPASGTGIYTYHNLPSNTSPQHSSHSQQHSQQSQSTVGVTTPTLMVNNPPLFQQGFQKQPQAQIPQANQQFNQQITQPSFSQVSPSLTPPQQFNTHIPQPFSPQVPPPTFHNIPLLIALLWAVMIPQF